MEFTLGFKKKLYTKEIL